MKLVASYPKERTWIGVGGGGGAMNRELRRKFDLKEKK
jgi:hypothetical protein